MSLTSPLHRIRWERAVTVAACRVAITAVCCLAAGARFSALTAQELEIGVSDGPNVLESCTLLDTSGALQSVRQWQDKDFVVYAFLGLDCPLSKLYSQRLNQLAEKFDSQGVAFVGVVANLSDELDEIRAWSADYDYRFPLMKDPGANFADYYRATINPEVVVVDRHQRVRYRGRIDDQYVPGLSRDGASREELHAALTELTAGQTVSVPETEPIGCYIQRPVQTAAQGELTYHGDVRPILHRRCVVCHQAGQRAPFSLYSYEEVVPWADTIRLVIDERRMPPWYAEPQHGDFLNAAAITEAERHIVLDWIAAGVPAGTDASPTQTATLYPRAPDGWSIPQPQLIVSMPEPFTVPATGIIDYQYITIDLRFAQDLWVQAAEIRPGNPQVVHHAGVFLVPPETDAPTAAGELGSVALVLDSLPQLSLPYGTAKRIPAGSRLMFVMHYTAIGSEQTDQTQLGLRLTDPREVRQEVATHVMLATDLEIPPHARDYRRSMSRRFEHDVDLLSLFPHMHYRGKSFEYVAEYPDGRRETLLSLPTWDFNWQHNYLLKQPKRLPAGTVLHATAHYDNSADNRANPDPTVTVRTGQQSRDEMFNAYYDFVLPGQDLTKPPSWWERLSAWTDACAPPFSMPLIAMALVAGLFLSRRTNPSTRRTVK